MKIFYTHENSKYSSHELLALAIAKCIGDESRALDLVEGLERPETSRGSGKPYIADFGSFSISHSENTWAVAICDETEMGRECGLDVQYLRKCNEVSIADRFYSPEDAEIIRNAPDSERTQMFFRTWTRREALIKAAGTSVAESTVPAVLQGGLIEYEGRFWEVQDLEISDAEGLFAAICLENGIDNFECYRLEI